eukprot:4147355-Amphidinium_carterae.1
MPSHVQPLQVPVLEATDPRCKVLATQALIILSLFASTSVGRCLGSILGGASIHTRPGCSSRTALVMASHMLVA